MTIRTKISAVALLLPVSVMLTACGGSAGSNVAASHTANAENTADTSSTLTTGAASQNPGTTTLSGRVADGYLRGVTVCIDINENDNCDTDEPHTISSVGGVYTLAISPEHEGKPILADVPADAIDEDTGEAFGREIVMSTPGGRPDFISPLTTLVHHELKENPSMTVDDAEQSLRAAMGLENSQGSDLFKDYVELGSSGDESHREKYQYLHQTARVVAGMMGEIRKEVRESVVESGIDIGGDNEAAMALRQLVKKEVREMMPDIAQAVTSSLLELRLESTDSGEQSQDNDTTQDHQAVTKSFDPDRVINEIKPWDIKHNASQRIEEIITERPVEKTHMQELLHEGLYFVDVNCDQQRIEYEDLQKLELSRSGEDVSGISEDHGLVNCEAFYAHLQADSESDSVALTLYAYDPESEQWIEESVPDDAVINAKTLIDGQWVQVGNAMPESVLEYSEDGAVVLETNGGTLTLQAASRALADTPVAHHLEIHDIGSNTAVATDQLFPDDSFVHKLFIKQRHQQILMFHLPPEQARRESCEQYSANCNLIYLKDQPEAPVATLAELQQASLGTVTIKNSLFHHFDTLPANLTLSAQQSQDGSLPTEGVARWSWEVLNNVHGELPNYHTDDRTDEQSMIKANQLQTTAITDLIETEAVRLGSSKWHLTEIDGQSMIEIDLPVEARNHFDLKGITSILLIENEGYVRRGAKLTEVQISDDKAYNPVAFDVLKSIGQSLASDTYSPEQ